MMIDTRTSVDADWKQQARELIENGTFEEIVQLLKGTTLDQKRYIFGIINTL